MDFEGNHPIKTNVYMLRQWLSPYIRFLFSKQSSNFFFKKVVNRFWCAPVYSTISINYYGDILPCNMLKPAKCIKDKDDKTLLELWNASCKTVRSMIEKQQYPNACKSCVCAFNFNVLGSALKHPLSNSHIISKVLIERIKYRNIEK